MKGFEEWPDPTIIAAALWDPKKFADGFATTIAPLMPQREHFIDSRWIDFAERCARAVNTQDLLDTMELELGEEHESYIYVTEIFWYEQDRLMAPLGAQRWLIDPLSPDFYRCRPWLRLRVAVIERDGGKCVMCGRTAADGIRINVDHIKPRRTHPHLALDPKNCQVLCDECNAGKGNRFSTDWRARAHAHRV